MATVDILLPVKNGVQFLAEALDSVVAQTFKDWRVLILDHGSTDGTVELAGRYCEKDPRFQLHSFPEAKGLSGLLNCGIELCDARYMMRHDADDVCYPKRIQITLDALKASPGCVAMGGQADRIDARGISSGALRMPVGAVRCAAATFFRNPFLHSAMIMDFPELMKMGARYGLDFIRILPPGERVNVSHLAEDYFLFGQLAILGRCNNVPDTIMSYRWHDTNVSVTRFAEQMDVSLKVSRYFVRSFCQMHDLPYFDPAPFCNHGGMLFNVEGQTDFSEEFERMAGILRMRFGDNAELERELAYRKVASSRNQLLLLMRYAMFRARYTPEIGEWNAVRGWLLRGLPGKSRDKRSKDVTRESIAQVGSLVS